MCVRALHMLMQHCAAGQASPSPAQPESQKAARGGSVLCFCSFSFRRAGLTRVPLKFKKPHSPDSVLKRARASVHVTMVGNILTSGVL